MTPMCGISGYFSHSGITDDTGTLRAMNRALSHRGPDGEGLFFLRRDTGETRSFVFGRTPLTPAALPEWRADCRIPHDAAFGHRRFAILDLSPGGHQPFLSEDGACALSFNGEIYNYVELRRELEGAGFAFRTAGDAEVLLNAYRHWGVDGFGRMNGFWALALWDGKRKQVLLARDRLGKAPLYVAHTRGRLWWSSEIKGLMAALGREAFAPRPEAASLFLRAGLRDWGNRTFFQGIATFPAASHAWIESNGEMDPHRFWRPPQKRLRPSDLGEKEAVAELKARLQTAVEIRLRADAPVGLELSGGLDSSAIAAACASARGGETPRLSAFTVGFPGTSWDEEPFARKVAGHWPSRFDFQVLTPNFGDVLGGLDNFQSGMDEPFHSPNMVLNQEIWRRMASAGIRVSLNGAGGDEVFAGYGSEYFGAFVRSLLAQGRIGATVREMSQFSERVHGLRGWARMAWMALPEAWRRGLRSPLPPSELDPLT
jgi:asparagine synthase (glutamine-hydrolysing)